MASREAMYRMVDNVDGVCNIDSDPGYSAGSPLERLLRGPPRMPGVARSPQHPRQADETRQLDVVWLGTTRAAAVPTGHQRLTIRSSEAGIAGAVVADLCGSCEFLPLCREAKVL